LSTLKRILCLRRGGTGILKIGKTLGIGTGTVQRVLTEQPRPFDADVKRSRPTAHRRFGKAAAKMSRGGGRLSQSRPRF
jgi:hypothetical protein